MPFNQQPSTGRTQGHSKVFCDPAANSAAKFASADIYAVGELHPYRDVLPRSQGMLAQDTPSGIIHNLLPTDCFRADVLAFQIIGSEFGLVPMRDGYAWLMRDGVATWDGPYCPRIEPSDDRELPWHDDELTKESRASISLILTEDRLVVRAIKIVSVSAALTRKLEVLHAKALAERPVCRDGWDAEMRRYFRAYSSPRKAFQHAVVTCKGGD